MSATPFYGIQRDFWEEVAMSTYREQEHNPGEPAPSYGRYEALNVFGRPTGQVVEIGEGEQLPELPRGFTWRPVDAE